MSRCLTSKALQIVQQIRYLMGEMAYIMSEGEKIVFGLVQGWKASKYRLRLFVFNGDSTREVVWRLQPGLAEKIAVAL